MAQAMDSFIITQSILRSYLLARGWESQPADSQRMRPKDVPDPDGVIILSDGANQLEWTLQELASHERRPLHTIAAALGLCAAAAKCYERALACRAYVGDVETPEHLRSVYQS